MIRKIIHIDEDKCDGCGECIPACHEGALSIIDGKCRLISDLFCDGLGACLGDCTKGALRVIEAEADEYDEVLVIQSMLDKPPAVMKAHLTHLLDHGANEFFERATEYLDSIGISVNVSKTQKPISESVVSEGCPGSKMQELKQYKPVQNAADVNVSMLGHWPIQLHLVSPYSPFLKDKELVILSTCSPVAYANTHSEYLNGKAVVLACPKLDYTDPYPKKIEEIFNFANVKKATVVRMEVPCCGGLSAMALKAAAASVNKNLVLHEHVISTDGKKMSEKIIFSNNPI